MTRGIKPMLRWATIATITLVLLASGCSRIDRAEETPFLVNFDPKSFDARSADIRNEWWPLTPGTQWLWEGRALDGEETVRRRLISTVTDLTKEIAGVRTLVVWERDYDNEILIESELFFLAQDIQGNIWHFGQAVELFDDEGALEGGHAWLVGHLEGAKAGIFMPAKPAVGTPEFAQGYAPAPYNWNDVGRVSNAGERVCVPAGCYDDVITIEEFEPAIEDAFQLKYWARGVGNIKTGWRGAGEEEQEVLELIRKRQLEPVDLDRVRSEALKLESRFFVYGHTAPLERKGT